MVWLSLYILSCAVKRDMFELILLFWGGGGKGWAFVLYKPKVRSVRISRHDGEVFCKAFLPIIVGNT